MNVDPTSVDLAELCRRLQQAFSAKIVPGDELEGKTAVRDRVVPLLDCSELEAERIVDTMVARGFLRFREGAREPLGGAWHIQGGNV